MVIGQITEEAEYLYTLENYGFPSEPPSSALLSLRSVFMVEGGMLNTATATELYGARG
jgi:hypothetical protein